MFKKLILFVFLLFFGINCASANCLTYDNEKYCLAFSRKNKIGYLNEYVRKNETVHNWTKMIGVYYYEIDADAKTYTKNFSERIRSQENQMLITYLQSVNLVSFDIVPRGSKKYFEYDVFRFEDLNNSAIIGLQFTKRYKFQDTKESMKATLYKSVEKSRRYENLLINTPMPKIVKKNIGE